MEIWLKKTQKAMLLVLALAMTLPVFAFVSFNQTEAAGVTITATPNSFPALTQTEVNISYQTSSSEFAPGGAISISMNPTIPAPVQNCSTPTTDADGDGGADGSLSGFSSLGAVYNFTGATTQANTIGVSICLRFPANTPQNSHGFYVGDTNGDEGGFYVYVGGDNQVTVTANVQSCIFQLEVRPEKRIPATNNWGTLVTVDVFSASNVYIGSVQANSNNAGVAEFDLCASGLPLTGGTYRLYVRGFSHLRRNYGLQSGFTTAQTYINLVPIGTMFTGETSVIYDNYINTLDISTQIGSMYSTSSIKNDLNRDGTVNVLDIANTITNFYLAGQ